MKRNIRSGSCEEFFNDWISAVQTQKIRFQTVVDESEQSLKSPHIFNILGKGSSFILMNLF